MGVRGGDLRGKRFSPQRRRGAENSKITTEAQRDSKEDVDDFADVTSSRGRGRGGHRVGRLRAALRGLRGISGWRFARQTIFHRRDAEALRTARSPQRHRDTEGNSEKDIDYFVGIASSRGRGRGGHRVGRLRAALRGLCGISGWRFARQTIFHRRRRGAEKSKITTEAQRHREKLEEGRLRFCRRHVFPRQRTRRPQSGPPAGGLARTTWSSRWGFARQTIFHRRDVETLRTARSPRRHRDTERNLKKDVHDFAGVTSSRGRGRGGHRVGRLRAALRGLRGVRGGDLRGKRFFTAETQRR